MLQVLFVHIMITTALPRLIHKQKQKQQINNNNKKLKKYKHKNGHH